MKKLFLSLSQKWKSINKNKLNDVFISLFSLTSLIISILAYSSSITGNVNIMIKPNGDISNLFEEDLFPELTDLEIESHHITDITYGVQQISVCFMNTSSVQAY